MFAEYAVILANLMVEDPANPAAKKSVGPHLFFARIQVSWCWYLHDVLRYIV